MRKFLDAIVYDAKFIKGHTLQPRWYKIVKVILLATALAASVFIFGAQKTLAFVGIFFSLSLFVHLVYRAKTGKFTKSWLDFVVQEIDGQLKYERIGIYYYLAVVINLLLSLWIIRGL